MWFTWLLKFHWLFNFASLEFCKKTMCEKWMQPLLRWGDKPGFKMGT